MLIAQLRASVAALKAAKKAPKPGFGVHIAHLANGEMLGEIAAAKADGVVSFCVIFFLRSLEEAPKLYCVASVLPAGLPQIGGGEDGPSAVGRHCREAIRSAFQSPSWT